MRLPTWCRTLMPTNLYELFGLDNGRKILSSFFNKITCHKYQDSIEISEATPIISYILSCHGNQNSILLDHYQEFKHYVEEKVHGGFHITKDVGCFICKKD